MDLRTLGITALGLGFVSCAHPARFALRAPITREDDARPFAHRPATASDVNSPYSLDGALLRPVSHVFLLERSHPARDVNSMDEVPDSTWFTNRVATVAQAGAGACADVQQPALPLTITSTKVGGVTPGFFARDARGNRFALKFDQYPHGQPEMNTAGDAVIARLYWALGYNAPCNDVILLPPDALHIGEHAWYADPIGAHRPMTPNYIARQLARFGYRQEGLYRFGISHFISGHVIGPWAAEGRRDDDPNDTIPHEDRRELRGERLLSAWINHWDARAPNSLDSFVPAPGGGYVLHYQFDFGDSLGTWSVDIPRSDHQGFTYSVHPGPILEDLFSFGAIHRPWDDEVHDPVVHYLGTNFDVAHFQPERWVPANPSPRFAAATDQDMAWMARRIVQIERPHLEAIMAAGRYSDPRVPARIVDILMGRRARILAWSFDRVSPLTDFGVDAANRFCAHDLGLATGVSTPEGTGFAATAWRGSVEPTADREHAPVERGDDAAICVRMPPHVTRTDLPDDSAERYTVIEIVRDAHARRTRLRAHFYDLGHERGYALVGIERL